MAKDLFKYPWISKAKGTTVHLLKSSAKTARKAPKRKKYELFSPIQQPTQDAFASYKKNVEQMERNTSTPALGSVGQIKEKAPSQIDVLMK